jgi:hypothetical protein
VFPQGEPGRNTTRYFQQRAASQVLPTITVLQSGTSVTIGGTAGYEQLAGVLINSSTYVYSVLASDTPEIVAANLAAAVRADWIVNLSGATLTIPGASNVLARVVSGASIMQEVRRQEQRFRITCWCPSPPTRDSSASAIDAMFASLRFIDLSDGTQGRLQYNGTLVFDQSQDALLYRRDLLYDVEYPTVITAQYPAMLFGNLLVNAGAFTA